ncbi:hypothetical protein BC936DRAFT_138498 [Jimgerdemannia flammicorona]|uniref:Uncharacterized protein n=2 Tax=Jimgerdemannia flammicorona TaxID=994334 RepID=A0A433CB82_9FUNG|nr:hypothetical protein BC936DRAFT_138498 [Jimgerdemannia flammicorona]RUS25485.1 hypothetical protein BC938DRAFT_472098 [Jimgerdemannia flammicorona]
MLLGQWLEIRCVVRLLLPLLVLFRIGLALLLLLSVLLTLYEPEVTILQPHDLPGEPPDRRLPEYKTQRRVHLALITNLEDKPRGDERMPTKVEEILVERDVGFWRGREEFVPDLVNDPLRRCHLGGIRGDIGGVRGVVGVELRGVGEGKGHFVGLAIGGERHSPQRDENFWTKNRGIRDFQHHPKMTKTSSYQWAPHSLAASSSGKPEYL